MLRKLLGPNWFVWLALAWALLGVGAVALVVAHVW